VTLQSATILLFLVIDPLGAQKRTRLLAGSPLPMRHAYCVQLSATPS
jgi:hypothetical protein